MCIVLVEDEALIRMLASELLTEAGHVVRAFGTAADAKAYCDVLENEVTAVLTDINMPGEEDGLDLAVHVVRTRPGTAVVVTSGRYSALPSGMPLGIGFLPKPWTSSALLRAVPPAI